jgi:transcriptional regulator with XRE-family HTH domain
MKMTSAGKQLFLAHLRRSMEGRGWTASKLATLAGVHQSQVSRIAAGHFETFGSSLMKICMTLDLEPATYCGRAAEDADRKAIADSAIAIWDGSRRDAPLVISLLKEIARLRKGSRS